MTFQKMNFFYEAVEISSFHCAPATRIINRTFVYSWLCFQLVISVVEGKPQIVQPPSVKEKMIVLKEIAEELEKHVKC
ncbi:hypothetical protein [Halalkalibacter wakoensis]|uniref:hypothetical protein n=1 Tax=Halalkalibacter wakoensis TaxID=127891 RepID=UPI000553661D|nr:hypothetical protein [Halalkalibacter wakoensis]